MVKSITVLHDTIVAISTPVGRGAIGIIRLSGDKAVEIAKTLFKANLDFIDHPFRLIHGEIIDPENNQQVDEALAVYFPNPKSFTKEDLIEFQCHGSPIILKQIIQLALCNGARSASPGEFTMRAFLNGRINLTQAEGIRDLINAQTSYQAKTALQQTKGELSKRLQSIKKELINIVVHLESAVEFVEENISTHSRQELATKITVLKTQLDKLLKTFKTGHLIRNGITLAIIGRPNVGKSSIFNSLLDSERAIVTAIPGTTRDLLKEQISILGLPVYLIDTAGICTTVDVIEQIGIEKSYKALEEADLVLLVFDASIDIHPDDLALFERVKEQKTILVLNKIDLPKKLSSQITSLLPTASISALTQQGIDELKTLIWETVCESSLDSQSDLLITDARHASCLQNIIKELELSYITLLEGASEEIPLASLHEALTELGKVTGEVTMDNIFDQIFSTFCIGK